jgi:hypothetical protein
MTRRRWNLSDLNEWHVAAANLRGLTLAEAEARIREMIEALQEEELANYELALRNIGADPADFAAVERVRTEHVRLREQAIENWRTMVALHQAQNDGGRVH